MKVDTK